MVGPLHGFFGDDGSVLLFLFARLLSTRLDIWLVGISSV